MDAVSLIRDAFVRGECRLLTFSAPAGGESAEFVRITWRPVVLKGETRYQATRQTRRQAFHANQSGDEAAHDAAERIAGFRQAALFTDQADFAIHLRPDGSLSVRKSPPTKAAVDTSHNRAKPYLIPEGRPCAFLHEIGVMTSEGQVRRAMSHKFRQINRFLELVNDVVPHLPEGRPVRVVDFGSGKSYLTFALHYLLTEVHKREAELIGLDQNETVIEQCRSVADRLSCRGLSFAAGTIATYEPDGPVDLAVSLHACDTATDDALAQAVRWECPVILAVPCCQHELAPRIQSPELTAVLKHGLLKERLASLATDALRACVLELAGYRTQIVEFIDLEHTPKNLLIRAVRRDGPPPARIETELATLKRTLGIEAAYLERLLFSPQSLDTARKESQISDFKSRIVNLKSGGP